KVVETCDKKVQMMDLLYHDMKVMEFEEMVKDVGCEGVDVIGGGVDV
ncbi:hypothetical protein Tco_0479928, partial [Tanacetum coccineum]